MCQLTILKDGRIIDTSLTMQSKGSAVISDQTLREIEDIITHTKLDVIPYETSAVQFLWSIPRASFAGLLESQSEGLIK